MTVEASSPVLIEKSRTVVTDDQGRYTIVDVRPGTYKVTFTLTGFSTAVRDEIAVTANVVANVNVEMKVGALEETITVSGQTPLVDVQQATRVQVLSRDLVDSLPTTRNIMSVGILAPGVRAGTPDIGGSRSMEQPSIRAHGLGNRNNVQMIDGMSIMSNESLNSATTGNMSMGYLDDAINAEVSISTSALSAENQSGGIRINVIPKDGGNIVSGAVFIGGSDGNWQSKNIDAYLRSRNIASANGISHIQNFNGSLGGPVLRERLWFFTSGRHISTDELVANVASQITLADGTVLRSILDQYVRDALARLTWQASRQTKLAAFVQRTFKRKGKDFGFGTDPRAAAQRAPTHGHYTYGDAKWTMTASSKLLVEAGISLSYHHFSTFNQPEVDLPRYLSNGQVNAAWLANGTRTDTALNINPQCAYLTGCTQWMSNGTDNRSIDTRHFAQASVSYVTGSHNIKVGVNDSFGPDGSQTERQADLTENFVNGKANTVTVANTPVYVMAHVVRDIGLFAQDTWTVKRLTLNLGLRMEYFNSKDDATTAPAGRFVPARYFPEVLNVPNWPNDPAPRLSAVYDLFGDGRTALKTSYSKYYNPLTAGFARRYTTANSTTETRNWFDCDINAAGTGCSGVVLPTNGDNIAQENEIGPSGSTNFGVRTDRNPDPGIRRFYNWETTVGVQHQLFARASLGVTYYHRTYGNLENLDRTLITQADYTSFTSPMPGFANDPTLVGVLDPNAVLTIYNLNSAKRSVFNTAQVDRNAPDDKSIYNGIETSFAGRLPRGAVVFGGWTVERNVSVFCTNDDNPNGPATTDYYNGESVSLGGVFCDQRQFNLKFRNEFKLSGNYPLWRGFEIAAVLQSYPGVARTITYTPAANLFPGGRTNSESLILNKPGSLFQPRYNQLDLNFKKLFRAGRKTYSAQFDMFNALNGNAIFTTNNTIGASLGQVNTILQGRIVRLAFQMKF